MAVIPSTVFIPYIQIVQITYSYYSYGFSETFSNHEMSSFSIVPDIHHNMIVGDRKIYIYQMAASAMVSLYADNQVVW